MDNKFIQIIKNKWLRNMTLTLLLVGIIICVYLVINFAVEKAEIADIDLTKEKLYSISQQTEDKLRNLDTDITISIYNMYDSVKELANQYARLNEHIKVEKVEDLVSKTKWKTDYGVTETSRFIVITTQNREKMLQEYDLYTMDYSTYQQIDITEEAITNGILDVTTTVKPKIYFLTGHNMYSNDYFQYLQNAFVEEVNEVAQLNLLTAGKVPDDCNVLVITALKEDIKEMEKDRLIDYIKKGGEILLLLDPNLDNIKLANFQKVLDEYGVSVSNGLIIEGDSNKMVSGAPNFVISTINNSSSITKNMTMDLNVCLMNPGRLNIVSDDELRAKNLTVETLATVSDKAFYRTDLQSSSQSRISSDTDANGATVAAMITKQINENTMSKVIIYTNTAFATNMQIPVSQTYYTYALDFSNNKDVILNSISYLTEREDNITIRKNIEAVNYEVTETQNRIILAIIFTVPVFIIIAGIVIWVLRRRKK
ncbi:MAG: GldG family protein [Clostridia bacterium]|nr:GldG family protein [Clostridia bacterium]